MATLSDRQPSRQSGWSLSLKLTAAYSLLALLVAGALTAGMYLQLRRIQRQVIRDRLQDIVSLAQPQIDSDFHSLIVSPNDVESSYYSILQGRLAAIQQTSDDIRRLYTLRETVDGQFVIVLDYPAPPASPAPIGRELAEPTPLLALESDAIEEPIVERSLQPGKSGQAVLHGYAPIVDPLGRPEGILAIELDASQIIASEVQARNLALLAFAIVLPLALVSGHWLTRRLTAPIGELVQGVERVAAGDLTHHVQARSRDEVGLLAVRFNEMSDRLYEAFETLEAKVTERTNQLSETNADLQKALANLQQTQSQLIQAEKMLGLGQMVAGIAHEINNPVGFIHSNLHHVEQYSQGLLGTLAHHQQADQSEAEAIAILDDDELAFIATDFPRIVASMRTGTERISEIVLALRSFSRLDEAQLKHADVREGLDSTLVVVQHRLHGENDRPSIKIVKDYETVPLVECYPSQLKQVFLNLLNNAIDALQESAVAEPTIWLRVVETDAKVVRIAIADNGPGMTPAVQQQVFNPFFTTKPVGCGTGLGLTTSYTIVVDQHGGAIACHSTPNKGTEFALEIPQRQTAG